MTWKHKVFRPLHNKCNFYSQTIAQDYWSAFVIITVHTRRLTSTTKLFPTFIFVTILYELEVLRYSVSMKKLILLFVIQLFIWGDNFLVILNFYWLTVLLHVIWLFLFLDKLDDMVHKKGDKQEQSKHSM